MDGSVYWRRVPRARRSQERRHRPSKWTDDLAEFVLFLARCGVGWRGWVTWPTLPLDGIPAPSRLILSEQWRLTCRHFFFSPLLFFFALFYVCVVANNRFLPLTLFRHCFFFFCCCSLLGVTLCAVPMFLHSRAKRGRSRGNQPNDSDLHNLPLRVSQRWWTCPFIVPSTWRPCISSWISSEGAALLFSSSLLQGRFCLFVCAFERHD